MINIRKKNKYIIAIIVMFLGIFSMFWIYKSNSKNDFVLDDVKLKEESSNNGFALMLEQEDGTYKESESSSWPTDMLFNSELSGCIDANGKIVDNVLSYISSTNSIKLRTNGSLYCYLYFKRDNGAYSKIVNDYKNGNGVSKLDSSESGRTYDTYYYTGDITNNNVLYAGFCWKMVITTEGNGVKMIYNGIPTNGSCDNSGDDSTIGTSAFNSSNDSPAYVGYMYNKVYASSNKRMSSTSAKMEYVYGNSVSWDGSNYTLVSTTSGNWQTMYSSLSKKHYTCFTTGTTCTSVYYINYADSGSAYYLTLTEGKSVEDALNEMLYNDDVNTIDSTIKAEIDSWYESNLKNTKDSSGNLYSSYLQNTIYCNNRLATSLGAFKPDGGSATSYLGFSHDPLDCENKTDQFTLRVDAGGEEGYGNNALKYPIGLLNYKEAKLARGSSDTNYLNNAKYYWILSPRYFGVAKNLNEGYMARSVYMYNGKLSEDGVDSEHGIRPVVSLSSNVEISGGDGSYTNPYTLELNT